MSLSDQISALQARLGGRQEPECQHILLRLARAGNETEVAEIRELVAKLPEPPPARVSPLQELKSQLIGKIKRTLIVDQYERLEAALSGDRCDGETWQLLFAQVNAAPLPPITFPTVRGPSDKVKKRSNTLLALLTRVAQARQQGLQLVTPDELRKAMDAKTDVQLQALLERSFPTDD